MIDKLKEFLGRHNSFILTTHDPADADGLGAQMTLAAVLRQNGKEFRIINSSAIPRHFRFLDPHGLVEQWDGERDGDLIGKSGLFLVDTADEQNIGQMKEAVCQAKEIFVIDHHEPRPNANVYDGFADPGAASTCEMTVEIAKTLGVTIDPQAAFAAYIGIAFDTGFFAYPKTGPKTLKAALTLLELGVKPNDVYRNLHENGTAGALLLQKKALSGLTLHFNNRVAVQSLRLRDFAEAGAFLEETEGFVNFPLKAKEVVVSILLKESPEGKIRCSLRSKGMINVAKIAQEFGGGGHINAAGFRSETDIDQTITETLKKIGEHLNAPHLNAAHSGAPHTDKP